MPEAFGEHRWHGGMIFSISSKPLIWCPFPNIPISFDLRHLRISQHFEHPTFRKSQHFELRDSWNTSFSWYLDFWSKKFSLPEIPSSPIRFSVEKNGGLEDRFPTSNLFRIVSKWFKNTRFLKIKMSQILDILGILILCNSATLTVKKSRSQQNHPNEPFSTHLHLDYTNPYVWNCGRTFFSTAKILCRKERTWRIARYSKFPLRFHESLPNYQILLEFGSFITNSK